MFEINPKGGVIKDLARKYAEESMDLQLQEIKRRKIQNDTNRILLTLKVLNNNLMTLVEQNNDIIGELKKLTRGPKGLVHFMSFKRYRPQREKIFIDFVRGDKDGRSKIPDDVEQKVTYPYSEIFMLKITNDGPAPIEFQTNRHAIMIELKTGESEPINENENYPITELYIANTSSTQEANVRVTVYA